MKLVPGWRTLLLMVALGMMLPAAAHARPRLAILNLVPRVSSIDPATDLPRGLPAEYRDISEFDIADTVRISCFFGFAGFPGRLQFLSQTCDFGLAGFLFLGF